MNAQHETKALAIVEAGMFLLTKFRYQARISGVQHAALLLRKQGVPLAMTLLLLRALR